MMRKIEDSVNEKTSYILFGVTALGALLRLSVVPNNFFRQHYTRLKNDQFREASEIVMSKTHLITLFIRAYSGTLVFILEIILKKLKISDG